MPRTCSNATRRRTLTSIRASSPSCRSNPAAGLNQVITLASPGVVADSNGFFHPIGDHAQTQFSIDNQPITDQQSRVYSNQISPDAVQSMEIITGVAPAEYGDKSSLIVHIVTKSGLDQAKPTGSVSFGYGSFTVAHGRGESRRRLEHRREFRLVQRDAHGSLPRSAGVRPPCTTRATAPSFFDRLDHQDRRPGHVPPERASRPIRVRCAKHLRSERHRAGATSDRSTRSTSRPAIRRSFGTEDAVHGERLRPPRPPDLHAQPGSVRRPASDRVAGSHADELRPQGGRVRTTGAHNVKFGGTIGRDETARELHARLHRPDVQPACLDANGDPLKSCAHTVAVPRRPDRQSGLQSRPAALRSDAWRIAAHLRADRDDQAAGFVHSGRHQGRQRHLQTRRAPRPLRRPDHATPRPAAPRRLVCRARQRDGVPRLVRPDARDALQRKPAALERLRTGRPVRGGPALQPGRRNQGEFGVQQGLGRWVVLDFGYFIKHTDNGYDFGVLFDTPIVFPVAWDHSRIDGFTGRINLVEHHGFSAFVVMAHTNAIFSPPGTGGILLEEATGDFRIDHDQKFNATTNLQYVFEKRTRRLGRAELAVRLGSRGRLGWQHRRRAGADRRSTGGYRLLLRQRRWPPARRRSRDCASGGGATRLKIPAEGTADDVTNPPRIAPRHLVRPRARCRQSASIATRRRSGFVSA